MRSFSALREDCNHPELIDLMHPRGYASVKAMGKGNEFHAWLEAFVKANGYAEDTTPPQDKDAAEWAFNMAATWTPPESCKAEEAIGLADEETPRWVEVTEPEPHAYEAADPKDTLLTAGRLDLVWEEGPILVVVDAKSGKSYLGDPWSVPQLVAQAVAAHSKYGSLGVRLGVYYARLGMFDYGDDRYGSEVREMFPRVVEWAKRDSQPRLGAHCLSCYSSKNCDAYQTLTRKAA